MILFSYSHFFFSLGTGFNIVILCISMCPNLALCISDVVANCSQFFILFITHLRQFRIVSNSFPPHTRTTTRLNAHFNEHLLIFLLRTCEKFPLKDIIRRGIAGSQVMHVLDLTKSCQLDDQNNSAIRGFLLYGYLIPTALQQSTLESSIHFFFLLYSVYPSRIHCKQATGILFSPQWPKSRASLSQPLQEFTIHSCILNIITSS